MKAVMELFVSWLILVVVSSIAECRVNLSRHWWQNKDQDPFGTLADSLQLHLPSELHRYDPLEPASSDAPNRVEELSEEFLEKHRCFCTPLASCPAEKISRFQSSEQCSSGEVCCTVAFGYVPGCGQLPRSPSPTQGVVRSSAPWVATLLLPTDGGYILLCSGTLIHAQVVLTAARCVTNLGEERRSLQVRLGDQDLLEDTDAVKHQQIPVETIVVHHNYSQVEKHHDLALLFLSRPSKLRAGLDTICVGDGSANLQTDRQCMSAAHGIKGFETSQASSDNLQLFQVAQTSISHNDCQESLRTYPKYPGFNLHDTFICARSSACDMKNDRAGSPLTCLDPKTGKHWLFGITSWAIGCSGQGKPGVFTRVDRFYPWLDYMVTKYFSYIESYFGFNQV